MRFKVVADLNKPHYRMKDVAKNKPSITPGCEYAAGAGGGVSRPLKLLDFEAGRAVFRFLSSRGRVEILLKPHLYTLQNIRMTK